MKEDPDFLTVEEVVALHDEQIERYGGLGGIRDKALLESAVAAPRLSFEGELLHESVFHAAAAYAFHLAQNQGLPPGRAAAGDRSRGAHGDEAAQAERPQEGALNPYDQESGGRVWTKRSIATRCCAGISSGLMPIPLATRPPNEL